jgi:putative ABC transport system permease protein
VRWSLLLAVALVGSGVVGIALAHPMSRRVQPFLLITGLLGVVLGTTAAAPATIRALGGVARRLPFAPRLALRDLARYQSRAAAALAATTLALAIAVSIIVLAGANQDRRDGGNLSTHELLLQVAHPRAGPAPDLPDTPQADLDAQAATVVAALGGGAGDVTGVAAVPLDVAFGPTSTGPPNGREAVSLGVERSPHSIEGFGPVYVATPALLALYGIDAASIDPAADLLVSDRSANRDEPFVLVDFSRRVPLGGPPVPKQAVGLPPYSSAPHALVTPSALERHGWETQRVAWIIESPHELTASQISAARAAAAQLGLAVEVRTNQDALATLRTGATAAGAVLALAIVAMAIGLLRGESARDVRTLTAAGASSRTRRALTASTAAALAGPAALLGTAGAYVALLTAYRSHLDKLHPVPVVNLLCLLIGLPLVAALAGWLFAGREPRAFARQALD